MQFCKHSKTSIHLHETHKICDLRTQCINLSILRSEYTVIYIIQILQLHVECRIKEKYNTYIDAHNN